MKTKGINIAVLMAVFVSGGCAHREEPAAFDTRTMEMEEEEPVPGISFEMESDSLEDEVEEVWFGAEVWDEEDMGVDL